MKPNRFCKFLSIAALAAMCLFAMAACSQSESQVDEEIHSDTGLTGGVAATVNGIDIQEDRITRSINSLRANNNLTNEGDWKDYLKTYKYTPESIRDDFLGQLIDQQLVIQCAEQRGVTVDDAEVQSYVDEVKNQYSSEEAWLNAVNDAGWDNEDAYKEEIRYSILDQKLQEGFTSEVQDSLEGDALLEGLQSSASAYSGAKRSSHILFGAEDEELANEVRSKIESGEIGFEDAVAEYSTDEGSKAKDGDVGWDKLTTFATEYQTALDGLEVGQISEVVKSDFGYHIIKVTDVWTAPDEITSVDQVPAEITDYIKSNLLSSNSLTAYNDWVVALHTQNTVVVNPMPENVPYYVDMSDVYSEEEMKDINEKAEQKLITGVEAEEGEADVEEAAEEVAEVEGESPEASDGASDEASGESSEGTSS